MKWKDLFILGSTMILGGQLLGQSFLQNATFQEGGLIRADTTKPTIYLTFTGGDYFDGQRMVFQALKKAGIYAQFFFTGDYYRNAKTKRWIKKLKRYGHYLGPHSDKHLLYASWDNRDSTLVTRDSFLNDLKANYEAMLPFSIDQSEAPWFMPPYEWYNQQISQWTNEFGSYLVNFTPGTRSNADYTTPDMGKKYLSSAEIYQSILLYEEQSSNGLNGFILLIHIGTHPDRTDKFYQALPNLITVLKSRGYQFGLLGQN